MVRDPPERHVVLSEGEDTVREGFYSSVEAVKVHLCPTAVLTALGVPCSGRTLAIGTSLSAALSLYNRHWHSLWTALPAPEERQCSAVSCCCTLPGLPGTLREGQLWRVPLSVKPAERCPGSDLCPSLPVIRLTNQFRPVQTNPAAPRL